MRRALESWISFQRRQPLLFFFLIASFLGYAAWIALSSEIEAFPDFTNVQVQVITQYAAKAAEEIERQVTKPVEIATTGLPGLINQRSISLFGLSVVTLTFNDDVVSRQARIDVAQRLSEADLPEGVKPTLSPDTTPTGEIFRYTIDGDAPADEKRLIEDWTLEREFKSIAGVADVVSFGGPIRTIQVSVDLPKMKSLGLSVSAIAQALGQSHANAGGSQLSHGDEGYIVRSIGLFENPQNLENAVLQTNRNTPVRIRDVGRVEFSHRPRLGIVGYNESDDAVEGIILGRQGANSLETCRLIREKIERINSELPKGIKIHTVYDRTDLIKRSSATVFHNIFFGVLLVCLVLGIGLGFRYWPVIVAVALVIPFSLLVVFAALRLLGYMPNLISLGAVDFGIIIETGIFAAEAIIVARQRKSSGANWAEHLAEVLAPAFVCAGLLVLAFIPILSLQRVEGRIFRPLGITLVAALIGGQLGTLLFLPIAARFCPEGQPPETRVDRFFSLLIGGCSSIAKHFVSRVRTGLRLNLIVGAVTALSILLLSIGLGREFLPSLNEGSLYIRATAPSTISLEAAADLAGRIRARLLEIPEVIDVVSQTGRPDDGTDSNGFDNTEILATLQPMEKWKTARDLNGLVDVAQNKLNDFEGVEFNFSQPIKDNVDEAISGVKGELVVKVSGPELNELQRLGDAIAKELKSVPGAEDVASEQVLGQPELRFQIEHASLARYGIRVTDAEDVLESALIGKVATKFVDSFGRAMDVVVKPDLPMIPSVSLLSSLPVVTPEGAKIPLGELSVPNLVEGVSRIYRDAGKRRIAVKCSVRNRAVVDFVRDASSILHQKVSLPPGYRIEWSGSFENAERASGRLLFIVPLCILAIVVLLQAWFGSFRVVGLLLWELPFAAIGGLLALRLFHLNFSISAAAGGIVLIGVTLLTGMMLISEWLKTGNAWHALEEKGRSILVSSGVAIIGLVPAAFSHGIGSETAKPFAVMILGGLMTSLILSMTVLPALLALTQPARGIKQPDT